MALTAYKISKISRKTATFRSHSVHQLSIFTKTFTNFASTCRICILSFLQHYLNLI